MARQFMFSGFLQVQALPGLVFFYPLRGRGGGHSWHLLCYPLASAHTTCHPQIETRSYCVVAQPWRGQGGLPRGESLGLKR